jgi:hypothetical protein
MPLYNFEALQAIRRSTLSPWWRVTRWLVQTIVVLWLITRFLEENLAAHIASCLGVIILAEGRIRHQRSVEYQEGFGMGSWQALRALNERLDESRPPTDAQRADSDAQIEATPFEPGERARWARRIADPLEPYGTDLVAAAAHPRHWGTKFLRREIGNVRKAQRIAGIAHGGRGLPTAEVEDGENSAIFHKGLASVALIWAMLNDSTELISHWRHMGILLGGLVGFALLLEISKAWADHRLEKPILKEARAGGIEAAIHRMRSDKARSSWKVREAPSKPDSLDVEFNGGEVTIYQGGNLVFTARINRSHSKLRAIELFAPGDWMTLLKEGESYEI